MVKRVNKDKAGGLCKFLGKKYRWPKTKTDKCIKKAIAGRSRRRR